MTCVLLCRGDWGNGLCHGCVEHCCTGFPRLMFQGCDSREWSLYDRLCPKLAAANASGLQSNIQSKLAEYTEFYRGQYWTRNRSRICLGIPSVPWGSTWLCLGCRWTGQCHYTAAESVGKPWITSCFQGGHRQSCSSHHCTRAHRQWKTMQCMHGRRSTWSSCSESTVSSLILYRLHQSMAASAQYLPDMPEDVENTSWWGGKNEWTRGNGCDRLKFNWWFKRQWRRHWQQQWRDEWQCSDCQVTSGWWRTWLHCWWINRIYCQYPRPHSVERPARWFHHLPRWSTQQKQ